MMTFVTWPSMSIWLMRCREARGHGAEWELTCHREHRDPRVKILPPETSRSPEENTSLDW